MAQTIKHNPKRSLFKYAQVNAIVAIKATIAQLPSQFWPKGGARIAGAFAIGQVGGFCKR
jgi:hypothetical protein